MQEQVNKVFRSLGSIESKLDGLDNRLDESKLDRKDIRERLTSVEDKMLHHETVFSTVGKIVLAFWTVIITFGGTVIAWLFTGDSNGS